MDSQIDKRTIHTQPSFQFSGYGIPDICDMPKNMVSFLPFHYRVFETIEKSIIYGMNNDPIYEDDEVCITGRTICRSARRLLANEPNGERRDTIAHFTISFVIFIKLKNKFRESITPHRTIMECDVDTITCRIIPNSILSQIRDYTWTLDSICRIELARLICEDINRRIFHFKWDTMRGDTAKEFTKRFNEIFINKNES